MNHTCYVKFGRLYDPYRVVREDGAGRTMYDRGSLKAIDREIPVIVDHGADLPVGVVREIAPFMDTDGEWLSALCRIDGEPPGWLRPGTGVSCGYKTLRRSDVNGWDVIHTALLDEISVLHMQHACEPGARVLALRREESSPARVSDRPVAGEVIYREPAIIEDPYMLEVRRRMDWAERRSGRPADMEAILAHMGREEQGPTIDELYAEMVGRRVAA
jgi:hypothetical protein